ncbi:hypothetical protein ACH5RR_002321 [Cinchona calisaya]|uniref:BURP domain-containing protein n=1 Tax=Cinchona calisaya TaxID=153742 RepID=A0ABD3B6J2_9GENT
MDISRLLYRISLVLHLVILLGMHQNGASEVDTEKWNKISLDHDHGHDYVHVLDHDQASSKNIGMQFPKETNVLRLHSMDAHAHAHSSSHMMNDVDPSTIVFFFLHDLKLGKTMPIYFPNRDPSTSSSPHSLPKEKADNIPFSLQQLPNLLQMFSFSQGSPQAIAMENTLRECETPPIRGETKYCATSYESMLNFAREILGSETNIEVLSTIHPTKSLAGIRDYTIVQVERQISAPKMVACHTMPYPYTIFYCHYQESESRIYRISLSGENGERVEAIAVCHMDTSNWPPNHISFQVLGTKPGLSPVCHFFPADNFVLVPSTSSM